MCILLTHRKILHSFVFTFTYLLTFQSEKLYKDKFKEWGWQKNLPAKMALFMNEKAKQRKQEEGKDTIFSFGGRLWDRQRVENTLVRTKRPRGIENFPSKLCNDRLLFDS